MSSTVRETALDHISTAQPVAPLPAPEQGKALANGYGCDVFNTRVMRQRLPREVYDRLMRTMTHRTPLDPADADIIAGAMKDWALEHGATHYTHWFQPMTGLTAEKHDAFLSPTADGQVFGEFSGKMLIKGEPDASSFPSGGIRSTFEARGYTAWDPTSPVFLLGDEYGRKTLYIPTVFYSYTGEALDRKTPLMRSVEAVSAQALRILRLLGNTTATGVQAMVGSEQEYFLVDRRLYVQRPDLMMCGRTLYGAKPAKGQEMEDHYFGAISPRVMDFMRDVDNELWRLGVFAKTEHKEVAPGQYELACVYTDANTATDHNQLVMEVLRNTALKHGMVCLLHEKPFAGINGSGKHNNWSLSTDTGINLLEPGKNPKDNLQFLLFLAAIIQAVDEYQDLLRAAVAGAGNDQRLGGYEAPPAVISMFLGDTLEELLRSIERKEDYEEGAVRMLESGVCVVPTLRMDTTDRNRTSPFAFTGNKFEFRMLGSNQSISGPNIVLNTIVAEELKQFADELEGAEDFTKALNDLIRKTIKEHKRIIFNGDGYAESWQIEAEKRGLLNYKTTVEALPHFIDKKNIDLFTSHNVFTEKEMISRTEILLETYSKTINIEALTLNDMVKKQLLPALSTYTADLAAALAAKTAVVDGIDVSMEESELKELSAAQGKLYALSGKLDKELAEVPEGDALKTATYYRDVIFAEMQGMREVIDAAEEKVSSDVWPVPTYADIIFRV